IDCEKAASQVAELARQVEKSANRLERAIKSAEAKPAKTDDSETSDEGAEKAQADLLPKLTPSQSSTLASTVAQSQHALTQWRDHYRSTVPAFGWWVDEPSKEATKQLERYADILRKRSGREAKKDDSLEGTPLGATALAEAIRLEWLAYSADELIEIA